MKSQLQLYWESHRKIADGNLAFMEMVQSGDMDRAMLGKLLVKRPEVYSRFSNWMEVLP